MLLEEIYEGKIFDYISGLKENLNNILKEHSLDGFDYVDIDINTQGKSFEIFCQYFDFRVRYENIKNECVKLHNCFNCSVSFQMKPCDFNNINVSQLFGNVRHNYGIGYGCSNSKKLFSFNIDSLELKKLIELSAKQINSVLLILEEQINKNKKKYLYNMNKLKSEYANLTFQSFEVIVEDNI